LIPGFSVIAHKDFCTQSFSRKEGKKSKKEKRKEKRKDKQDL
jgi:hypothetical protein